MNYLATLKDNYVQTAALAAVLLIATPLNANALNAGNVFTSKVAWQNATSPGVTTLDFENYPGTGGFVGDFTQNGVLFDAKATYGDDQYIFSWSSSSGYDQGTGKWMLGGFSVPGSYRRYLEVSVPTTYNSFGLDVGTYGQSGYVSVLATTSLGAFEKIVATPFGGTSFVGFTLGAGENLVNLRVENVASLTGGVGSQNFTFDNFVLGTAATRVPFDIPGGATFPTLGSLLALGVMRKARKFTANKQLANTVTETVN